MFKGVLEANVDDLPLGLYCEKVLRAPWHDKTQTRSEKVKELVDLLEADFQISIHFRLCWIMVYVLWSAIVLSFAALFGLALKASTDGREWRAAFKSALGLVTLANHQTGTVFLDSVGDKAIGVCCVLCGYVIKVTKNKIINCRFVDSIRQTCPES